MASIDQSLIDAALDELQVVDLGAIGADGAQKAVRKVKRDDTALVLKVIAVGATEPDALRRAEREVELLASLDSPHVVRVESPLIELGDPVVGAAWLEEFLDGSDLTPLLGGGEWSWTDAIDMARQLGLGLAVGHNVGVIHRDLSSNNVRRVSDGTYKILDFGFARHTLRSSLTVAGQPGTRGFLSPEHLNSYSGGPMPASDIFGVGILLYTALTAESPIPFRGDDADYFHRLAAGEMVDLGVRRSDLTEEQVNIVRRCLHSQSARRFRTGSRLVEAIDAIEVGK